ncbi:hypothetical protein [Hymenobacter actinosclerus]|uniref:Uncharacterized protein n=1 Tax=Hymenobacter actinosclerus TaxID=82805 RepID=A0A1I0I7L2_9BACT|nr:hypothetical protein [Hymenobacter actinosclerus]SET91753.1 hypothetical protein SAMN04487998_3150 [Hymenobacter actinosclerus]
MRKPAFLLLLALGSAAAACQPQSATTPAAKSGSPLPAVAANGSYPAAEGFDAAGSDARALALADQVMAKMGGYAGWQQTRLLGWDFLDGSYQLWDKQTGDFRWQKDSTVALYNLGTRQGKAYRAGRDISATPDGEKLLGRMYPIWVNNSWWLLMPFKLKDSGVTLTYKGPGQFMSGQPAEVLHMTFKNVGVTPDNKYEVLINPQTLLVEEWAYFPKATDAQPAFRRHWTGYQQYGPIRLAADRSDGKDGRALGHISASTTVPAGLMQNPRPVAPL